MTADERDGERLQQLLDIEDQLEARVRAACDNAERRLAAARAARDQRVAAAHEAAAHADEERAVADRLLHDQALAAIDAAHQAALARRAGLSAERVDELARWVIEEAIGARGGSR
jgi:hypothetical protein